MSQTLKNLKYFCLMVVVALFMMSTIFVQNNNCWAETTETAEVEETQLITNSSQIDNAYNKIHFYIDTESHATIDDYNELESAVNNLTTKNGVMTYSDNTNSADNNVNLTVQFNSDFMQTEQFLAFSKERENIKTIDELHEFRSRLNAYSKEYHANI